MLNCVFSKTAVGTYGDDEDEREEEEREEEEREEEEREEEEREEEALWCAASAPSQIDDSSVTVFFSRFGYCSVTTIGRFKWPAEDTRKADVVISEFMP